MNYEFFLLLLGSLLKHEQHFCKNLKGEGVYKRESVHTKEDTLGMGGVPLVFSFPWLYIVGSLL